MITNRTRARRRSLRSERGQALVEFVLLLPVFLLITFGLIEFGKAFNYWIDLTHLSNEGARYAAVNRWPTCPSDDTSTCTQTLKEYLTERANTSELASGGTANVDGALGINICYPETAGTVGNAVKVTVSTKYTLAVVDGLFSAIGLDEVGKLDMASSATMRLERTPSANRLGAEVSACPT